MRLGRSRLLEFLPKPSSFFLPDTLLYQGYGICTGQWTCLQEFVAHSELLIERLHLVCFLFCSKFPKIHIYRNIMSFPVFRIITALFASFCNNRDRFLSWSHLKILLNYILLFKITLSQNNNGNYHKRRNQQSADRV